MNIGTLKAIHDNLINGNKTDAWDLIDECSCDFWKAYPIYLAGFLTETETLRSLTNTIYGYQYYCENK